MTRDEQVRRNLELAGDFLAHLLEHPDELDALPDGAHVVLMPNDDPELLDANFELARSRITGHLNGGPSSRKTSRHGMDPAAEGVYLQPLGS